MSKISAAAKRANQGDALDKPDGSGLAQLFSKSGPSSPTLSDTPPSPSSHSSSSSMNTDPSSDIKLPPSYCSDDGDIFQHCRPKGFSTRKAKWMSKYRCDKSLPSELRLITWNVDFSTPNCEARILRILSYIQSSVLASPPEPCCILLQELDAKSLRVLLASEWVRKHFVIAPDSPELWATFYGNATLVSRSIPLHHVVRSMLFWNTNMGRQALFVDIPLRSTATGDTRVVRVANTHLESLVVGTKARPAQLKAIAEMLRSDEVDGGVVGGDMNMIGDTRDQNIHVDAGLEDACLFPDQAASHTWGYQPPCQYPPRRLDRVFFTGKGLLVDSVEVIADQSLRFYFYISPSSVDI
ncbi:hypothetical protein TRAPUB_12034 [Trametes pubescens]|uniref:Endonuclease/exonuclease/phosphatase domain-containing protein n=1 Tax=Trametes pubescens TaxID=154538 RepID=A0A1M2VVC0_TRAPU|nr:hypothetical protein TRAPUB_12034 [Trametes pubescens]